VVEAEENVPTLFHLMIDNAGRAVTKELPLDALFELTIGVAARVARHRRTGLPALDDHALEAIADACYQAVMP
jgi:hypothetical protein